MMQLQFPFRFLITLGIAALLTTGCGSGGSEGSGSTAPSTPTTQTPPTPPSVQSIAPAEGAMDTVVTVNGSGLSRVTSVTVNGMAAVHTLVSDVVLTFRVPASATTGPIVLVGQGFNVQASPSFKVTGIPTITAVSVTNAPVSTNVSLTGRDLTRASAFWVGTEALSIVSAAPDRVIVRTPTRAVTGRIEATELGSNVRRASSFDLAVWAPISVASFSPTSAVPGDTITVTGVGLEGVTEVGFASAPLTAVDYFVVTVPDSKTSNSLTVKIPSSASTGQIALRSAYELVGAVSTTALTVLPKVLVSRINPIVSPPTIGSSTGEALYRQKVSIPNSAPLSCEDCHGPANIFRTRPQFANLTEAGLAARITLAINNPAYGMGSFSALSPQMRLDVALAFACSFGHYRKLT